MHHMTRLILFLLVFSAAALPAAAQTASTTSGEPPAVPTPAPIPDGLEAFLEGRRLEAAGRLRDAAAAYEQAMQQAPGVTEIRVSLAALLQQVGLSDRVVELLRDQEPMDWYGRRVYAMALANVMIQRPEMAEAALAAIQDAAEERADDPGLQTAQARVLHRLGRVAEAEVIIADLRAARGGGAQLASYHGRLLEELDRLDDAVEVFSTCADVFSGCRDGLVDVSIASGRLAEAGQALLLDTPNDETDTLLRAAALLSDGGRPDEALATVRRVLTQVPDSPRALTLEALILTDVGRLGEAAPKLRRLLRDDPENPDLLLAAAWAQADRGRGDVDAAREFLNRAWEVVNEDASVPVSTRVCLTGARIELLADRPSAAREWLARIAEPGSMGAELLQLLAESFRRTESWTEGVGDAPATPAPAARAPATRRGGPGERIPASRRRRHRCCATEPHHRRGTAHRGVHGAPGLPVPGTVGGGGRGRRSGRGPLSRTNRACSSPAPPPWSVPAPSTRPSRRSRRSSPRIRPTRTPPTTWATCGPTGTKSCIAPWN
jgi:tetratricopeptide (TPR) repeat protein